MSKPTLVVLAAGMGSRYGGLKQIDPVGPSGEIIIDYSIYDAIKAGFGKIVFVIRKDIEEPFKKFIGDRFAERVTVAYAYQELNNVPATFTFPESRTKPWGTGQAILVTEGVVAEPFAAINADDFYGRDSFQEISTYLSGVSLDKPDYSMVGFELRKTLSEHGTVARGLCQTDASRFLRSVTEITSIEKSGDGAKFRDAEGNDQPLTGNELVSMNMWGFTPALYPQLKNLFARFLDEKGQDLKSEFYIPMAVNHLVNQKVANVKVLSSRDSWFGVTYKEDKAAVVESIRALVQAGVYPEKLWS
ncbi:MAG: nucleotidyltransferase [Verrucomicrobiota bacterium]|nr:nucleotidyltransferase [Verrucomicrobiota bacterium]